MEFNHPRLFLCVLAGTTLAITVGSMTLGAWMQREAYRRFQRVHAVGGYICPDCGRHAVGTYLQIYDWTNNHDCEG